MIFIVNETKILRFIQRNPNISLQKPVVFHFTLRFYGAKYNDRMGVNVV